MREARNQVRKIDSVVGPLHLGRDYGWCHKCQDCSYPADVRWGLQPNAPASPRVQEMAAEAVLKMPSAQAEKSLPRLGGCSLRSTTLHREASRQGQRALALQKADQHRTSTVEGVVQLANQAALPKSLLCSSWNWTPGISANAPIGAAPKPCEKGKGTRTLALGLHRHDLPPGPDRPHRRQTPRDHRPRLCRHARRIGGF